MNNLLLNALKQIAIARNIKSYKDTSREELLIALVKSNEKITKLLNDNDSNTEIGETKNSLTRSEVIFHEKKQKNIEINFIKKNKFIII